MLTILSQHHGIFIGLVTLLGLIMGSFLNVVIYRLPIMLRAQWQHDCQENASSATAEKNQRFNLALPSSHCPHCQRRLSIVDNIPLLSFILLRGRCRYCQQKISWQYILTELFTAMSSGIVASFFLVSWQCGAALFFTWALIALSAIDYKHHLLPDSITLPLLWTGLVINATPISFVSTHAAVIGAAVGYGTLGLIAHGYKLLRGKVGMGQGDWKLLAAIGAWFAWQSLPFILLIASLLGSVIGITMLLSKRIRHNTPLPFGPYLALAAWLMMLWLQNQWW
ncbi:MAG: prepilin peptidase [Gammaproteobacteria bacterium]|nr:prepilin peptidase [Gammaproteobacteria bacterium]